MAVTPEQRQAAADPDTPAVVLAQLAAVPELQMIVAGNPATPDDVLDWLLDHGSAETRAAFGEVVPTDLPTSRPKRLSAPEDLWAEEQAYRRAKEAKAAEAQAARERLMAQRDVVRDAQDLASRASEIKRWEAAWSLAHDGQVPPPGFAPPVGLSGSAGYGARPTNPMAIAAFVSVFFIAILGVILGNIALRQIRDSGDGGHGLALAAEVIGWVQVIGGVIGLIVYFAVIGSLGR